MNPRLKASRSAIELIKRFEGFRPASAQLADGRWTIGHGHTKTARPGVEITEDDAEALLLYDLMEVQAAIGEAVFTPLNQNQFDALVAFTFNVGLDNFRSSSVLRRINEGSPVQAACAIEMWRKADLDGEPVVVDALVRRRAAEKSLFLTPEGPWVAAPSPIVRPRVDYDVGLSLPRTSADVSVSMHGDRGVALRTASPGAEPASAAATESIIERLKSLNLAEADAGIDLTPPTPATPQAADDGQQAPASTPEPSPLAQAEPAPTGETATDTPDHTGSDGARRIAQRETPIGIDDDPFGQDSSKLGGPALLGLGAAGLALFAGSVFWGVTAEASGGLAHPLVAASVFGLAGIGMVASAVYFLLVKLGGKGE